MFIYNKEMQSIDEFMPSKPQEEEVVTKQKRKRKDSDDTELKKKAKFLCKCPEQWTTVNRMSTSRLTEWINEQEYSKQAEIYGTVTDFAHNMFALVCDRLSSGDGYVETELKSDMSIKECLKNELGTIVSYLTNRWKLGALAMIDVTNAKRRQFIENPTTVIEEINDAVVDDPQAETPPED
jgi:hypothetical protein